MLNGGKMKVYNSITKTNPLELIASASEQVQVNEINGNYFHSFFVSLLNIVTR